MVQKIQKFIQQQQQSLLLTDLISVGVCQKIEQISKFLQKYANRFDGIIIGDIRGQYHYEPFTKGVLFNEATIFESGELLLKIIELFAKIQFEFVDNSRIRKVINQIRNEQMYLQYRDIPVMHQLLSKYIQSNQLNQFQDTVYQSILLQLKDLRVFTKDHSIQVQSSEWKRFGLSDKMLQLLLVSRLISISHESKMRGEQKTSGLLNYDQAYKLIDQLITKGVFPKYFNICGSMRRYQTSSPKIHCINDIDIIIDHTDRKKTIEAIESLESIQLLVEGPQIIRIQYMNCQIDIYVKQHDAQLPVMILFLTGNKSFNIFIRKRAKAMKYKLSNMSFTKNNKQIHVKSEHDIFKKLGLKYIEPRYRSFYTSSVWDLNKSQQMVRRRPN